MEDVQQQEYCLRWNNHQTNFVSSFNDLRQELDFVDVTLACEGQSLQAHKVNKIHLFYSLDVFYFPNLGPSLRRQPRLRRWHMAGSQFSWDRGDVRNLGWLDL